MPEAFEVTRLETEGLEDFHVHPDYSIDAVGTIEQYCRTALRRGLTGICFTTHYDTDLEGRGDVSFIRVDGTDLRPSVASLEPYVRDVLAAREKYAGHGLKVYLGLEFGFYVGCEETVREIQQAYDFDYFMAGVHELEGICICASGTIDACYSRYTPEQMVRKYFSVVLEAARCGLFDTIAHVPYYLRYGGRYYTTDLSQMHEPHLEAFLTACRKTGTGLEINTSGIRHGHDHYYPTLPVIEAARIAGVEVSRLGSDSHCPTQLGLDFDRAAKLPRPTGPGVR